MLVMTLKNADGTEAASFFVDVVAGEIRVRSGAAWDMTKQCYVERKFDVVTQKLVDAPGDTWGDDGLFHG